MATPSSTTRDSQPTTASRRWWPRFSLRTALIAFAVIGAALGYVGNIWHRVRHQQQLVAKIEATGGWVRYDYQFGERDDIETYLEYASHAVEVLPDKRLKRTRTTSSGTVVEVETPPAPWLVRRLFGDDVFARVTSAMFGDKLGENATSGILRELSDLRGVRLGGPQLNDDWLNEAAQLPHLRFLNLDIDSESAASAAGIASLNAAPQLASLGLMGEGVNDDLLAGVSRLRRLQSLSLVKTPNVTSSLFARTRDLANLRELCIMDAKNVGDDEAEHLAQLKDLQKLLLLHTSISDRTLQHITGLKKLRWLSLPRSNVTDAGMEHLARLPELQRLNLSYTQVGDSGAQALSHSVSLRHLDLSGTNVGDEGVRAIAQMTQLESLELWPTLVTDEGIVHVQQLTNLKKLVVGPHVTEEAAEEIRSALPKCEVRKNY